MIFIGWLQKSLLSAFSKNVTKCLRKCVRNWANIYKMPLWMHCRKDNKKYCKKLHKLYQKPSPKGEPRTRFSDPNAAKNNVLPACQLLVRHVLYFCVFFPLFASTLKQQFYLHGSSLSEKCDPTCSIFLLLKVHLGGPLNPLGSKTLPTQPQDPPKPRFLFICAPSGVICHRFVVHISENWSPLLVLVSVLSGMNFQRNL